MLARSGRRPAPILGEAKASPQGGLRGRNGGGVPMPTRRTSNDAMISEFSEACTELARAAVAEAEAWAEIERAIEAARHPRLIPAGKSVLR
jgi:hypothetical protein